MTVAEHTLQQPAEWSTCPVCGVRTRGLTRIGGEKAKLPQPGDMSVCAECGSISTYVTETERRITTQDELDTLNTVERQLLQQASISAKRYRGGKGKSNARSQRP